MPPAPSGLPISYGPSRVPGERDIGRMSRYGVSGRGAVPNSTWQTDTPSEPAAKPPQSVIPSAHPKETLMAIRPFVLAAALLTVPLSAATTITLSKPEMAGMSADRLARIGPLIQSHIAAKDLSGAVTLVARHGKVVHFEAHGLADVEANRPMKTSTPFRMASMTKPLTAVSILMLLEEGKLLLSDPVSKYIVEFKNPKVAVWNLPNDPRGGGVKLVSADREVTLQHILTHTAGLAVTADGPAGDFFRKSKLDQGGISLAEFSKRSGELPLNFQPGTQWQYTGGVGFAVLGRVVEIVSGMNLEQFFKQRILTPLNMNNTFFAIPADRMGDVAAVYLRT